MNTEKNHNRMQPAFPSVCDTETKSILNFGMTLRDYFAAKADVSAHLKEMSLEDCEKLMGRNYPNESKSIEEQLNYSFELECKMKFMKADVMLKQREL